MCGPRRQEKICAVGSKSDGSTSSVKQGWSKRPFSKAAASEGQGVPAGYVEGLNETSTKPAVVFTILPGYSSGVDFRCLINRAR